jgi:hypothetical protein
MGITPRTVQYYIQKDPDLAHLSQVGAGRPKGSKTFRTPPEFEPPAKEEKFSKEEEELIRIKVRESLIQQEIDQRVITAEKKLGFLDKVFAEFVVNFETGKFSCTSMADLDKLIRMSELLRGNADSHQQISGAITLEAIQQRFHQAKQVQMNKELTGEVEPDDLDALRTQSGESQIDSKDEAEPLALPLQELTSIPTPAATQDVPRFDAFGNPAVSGVLIPPGVTFQ